MELKGKQVEAFVKALDESEKMNKEAKSPFQAYDSMGVKEINCIYEDPIEPIISVVDNVELEKLKEIIQKQGTLKVNPKLVKECDVTTEWVKEDKSNDEEEVPVTVVEVIKKCDSYRTKKVRRYLTDYEKGFYTALHGRAPADYIVENKSYCIGTKECEFCTCGGDKRKCNFYPTK